MPRALDRVAHAIALEVIKCVAQLLTGTVVGHRSQTVATASRAVHRMA
jgi:hypothetical protein